jgi:hypothetical protein
MPPPQTRTLGEPGEPGEEDRPEEPLFMTLPLAQG